MEVPLGPRLQHQEGNLKLNGIVIRRVGKQVMKDMACGLDNFSHLVVGVGSYNSR